MNNSKNSVRTLTMLALLVAMSIVFSQVLSISTGFVRFNLGSLPVLLAALLFGPGAGFAVGAVADMIGGVLAATPSTAHHAGRGCHWSGGGACMAEDARAAHRPAAADQRAAGTLCGFHGHHLAGTAHLLRLPVGNAGSAHPQCTDPGCGEHCAAAHPAGEPYPDEDGEEIKTSRTECSRVGQAYMAFAKGIAAEYVLFCAHKRVPEKRPLLSRRGRHELRATRP